MTISRGQISIVQFEKRDLTPKRPRLAGQRLLVVLVVLLASARELSAQPANPQLTVIHQAPRKPAPGKPPLLVLLHGFGANEKDLLPMAARLDARLAIASPRAPFTVREGSYSWMGGNTPADLDRAKETVLDCIEQVASATGADRSRVYLAGFSQGAMLTLAIALTEPQKIAGAAVLSGRIAAAVRDQHAAPDAMRGFPILVTHGTEDAQIPVRSARDIRQLLKTMPVKLEYHEFDSGHYISDNNVGVLDGWLRQQLGKK